DRRHGRPRKVLEKREERGTDVLVHGRRDRPVGLVPIEPDAGVAEYGHPDSRQRGWHQQYAKDELADGTATRDPGDEHADKRRPGNPPGPVEERPRREPLSWLVREGRER